MDADRSVQTLIDGVSNLSGILHSFNNVVERLKAEIATFDPSRQIH
jgi:hypothetical protein